MAQDATIISASLNDSELKNSIDNLVKYVEDGTKKMSQSMNNAVEEMKKTLQSLGNTKVDMGGTSDGGSSKRAKKQEEEAKAVKETAMSYDKLLGALQMAQRQERLYASKKPFSLSKEELEKYAETIKRVEELQRELNSRMGGMAFENILKHQGVTDMREYITSLMKPNESLKRLNDDYKEWERTSKQTTQAATKDFANYSDEILKQAERIRNSETFKKTGAFQWTEESGDVMRVFANEKKYGSIEEQLVQMQQIRINNAKELFGVEEKTTEKASDLERIRERQSKAQEEYLASRKTEAEIQAEIQKNAKDAADALSQSKRNQGNIQNLSTDFRYEATIDELKRLREAYNKLDADTKRSPFGKELKSYINGLEKSLVSLGDKMRDESLMSANIGKSYDILTKKLVRLQTVYNQLNETERNSDYGNKIADSIQRTSRSMQEIQNQKMRPKNIRDILGLDEKTLDDIAYKMQMLQRYRSGLDVNAQRSEINQVNQAYDRLKAKMDEVMAKSAQMNTINNALTRSFNYMKNRLAFYFTVGASTSFVKQLIDVRSQYELTERSLGILVQSAEKGTQIFQQLSQMSLVSPYTLIELSNAARQLTAYGIAAKDVVDTTRRLADISAAVGAPVERIAYALGHVQSYGYLTSLQARQFANSGIPLVKELANRYSELEGRMVTTADVYDRMKKKQVEYADVMDVVNKMTDEGGRFFDFQAKQADTLKVQLANLNLAWNNMLNEMGQKSQGVLTFTIKSLKQLFLSWESINDAMYTIITAYGLFVARSAIMQLMLGKETSKHMKNALSIGDETAATYQDILAKKKLTKAEAEVLLALNRTNVGLRTALVNLGLLGKGRAMAIANANRFTASLRLVEAGVRASFGAIATGIKSITAALASNVWLIAITAIADLAFSLSSLGKATKELNESISNSAKEASDSLNEFLTTAKKMGTYDAAIKKTLSGTSLEKTWTNLSEEIRNSSAYGQEFINQLMLEEDLAVRVSKAFEIADKIEAANLKMKDFFNVEISEDIWHGLFGEGLISDYADYAAEQLGTSFHTKFTKWISGNPVIDQTTIDEMNSEMKGLANSIKKAFSANNITDPDEIREALTKIREQIVSQNEELKGDVGTLFRADFDRIMSEAFGNNLYDKATSAWKIILDEIKASSSTAFTKITDDILDNNAKWAPDQAAAIDKAFENVRKKLGPAFSDTLDEMQRMIDGREFKVKLLGVFDIQQRDDIQKDFDKRYQYDITGVYSKYRRKTGEDNIEWQNRLAKDLKAQKEIRKQAFETEQKFSKDTEDLRYKDAVSKRQSADDEIKALEDIGKAYNLHYETENNKSSKKDPLLDALKQEISLVEKLQGDYDKLTKAGATSSDALLAVRSAYGTTIDLLNKDMKKYGLPELNLDIITSQSPKEQLEYFKKLKQQLEASGLGTLDRMKAVEGIIEKLDIKVKEYNLDMVTKGLNNELGKLKEEYELAVEFDANPELGNVFADMIGIDKDELKALPRSFEDFAKKAQDSINKMFKENEVEGSFDLTKMLNKEQFDSWVKARGNKLEDNFVKALNDIRVEANKIRQNETKKQVEDWNKLLEKYADYEYQISKIHEDAEREREVARKQGAGDDVINAINNRENKDIARVNFEKFQQSQEWIIATGDLAGLTDKALGLLIDRLEEYKKNAKNLDPKQIRQINSALKTLYNNVRSKNPFKALSITIKENRLRREELEKQLEQDQEAFQKSNEQMQKNGHLSEKDSEARLELIDRIKRTKEELASLKDITPEDLTQAIQSITQTASMAAGAVTDMMKAFGADDETVTIVNGVMSSLEKAASFAAVGASIGGVWGAAIGGVIGLFSGLVSSLGEIFSGNAAITEQIEKSKRKVAELENTYKNLERAVEDAYGAAKIYTQEVAIQNKKIQLQQLERQLALEESRKSKYRDEDAIISIKGQIIDLRNEIEDMQRDIVNTFLGISDAGSAVENMVEVIINALRQGENAMSGFNESVDDMIANMIKQVISAKIVGPMFDRVWEDIQKHIDERVQNVRDGEFREFKVVDALQNLKNNLAQYTTKVSYYRRWWNVSTDEDVERIENLIKGGKYQGYSLFDEWREREEKLIEQYEGMLSQAAIPTFDDIRLYGEKLREIAPELEPYIGDIDALLTELGLKKGAEQTLSNLQQGIQGVTEDTASAIEAYMNGVSQQVYLHSDLLTEIRDAVVGMNFDTQLGTIGEILLQLQNSFQTQQAIRGILEGWSNANGMAVKVEMV